MTKPGTPDMLRKAAKAEYDPPPLHEKEAPMPPERLDEMTRSEWLTVFLEENKIKPDSRTARIAERAGYFMWQAALREATRRERNEKAKARQ